MEHDQGHGFIDHEIMEFSWVMMSANSNLKVWTESKEPCWDLEYFLLFLRFSILHAQWSNTPTSWHNVTPCVHCVLHHCWVKTRGMCLDARADFWGKKVVFSQTNSHLLSGRGGRQKGGTSAIIAAPSCLLLLLLGCSTWLLQNQSKGELTFLKNMSTSQTGHWCWVVCKTTSVCFLETLYLKKQWSCPKHLKSKNLHRRF